jgi:hypothetical protein
MAEKGSGRTLLGAVVDPLGLFSGSGLVEVDSDDRKALQAAAKLGELLQRSQQQQQQHVQGTAASSSSHNTDPLAVLAELGPQELVAVASQVAQRVGPKLWAKRAEAVMLGSRFAGIALQQQATRLEKKRVGGGNSVSPAAAAAAAAAAGASQSIATAAATVADADVPFHEAGQSSERAKAQSDRLARARELLLEAS